MTSHVHHEIYLHVNWHTKDDYPSLRDEIEELTHAALRDKCRRIRGAYIHAIGGTDNHVHIAVSIEPSVTISELVQELKGASAREVNKRLGRKALEWQRGYGVVSFGQGNLRWVLDYIAHQREHHSNNRLQPRLEAQDSPRCPSEKPG